MSVNNTKFSFSWNTIAARGFADGDAVSADFDNDSATSYSGVKGEGDTVLSRDRRGTITVRIKGSSKTVSEYLAVDKALTLGEISLAPPFIYKKVMGDNTMVATGTCALSKIPVPTSNRDMPEYEFVFKASDMEVVVLRDQ